MSLSESQSYTVTLSGRELALRRRQAMSSLGKSAVRGASHKSPTGSERQRKSAQNLDQATGQNWPFNPMPVRESQASESQASESQAHEACGPECGCDSNKSEPAVSAGGPLVRSDISSRTLARMRREAASKTGKAGQQRVAKAVQVAQHLPASQLYSALSSGPSGRQVAMQRRLQQSLLGRAGHRQPASNSSISSSQSSSSMPAAKVEIGHTLSGQLVTGQL
ncbi:MAG: CsoS2 family carboxysome shell protein, partial [Burkholderiaceae bacterium]